MTLIKLNDRTYINPDCVILVAFNSSTLKTGVFLTNGAMVDSDMPFDETAKALNQGQVKIV